jgi:hypothetical protein
MIYEQILQQKTALNKNTIKLSKTPRPNYQATKAIIQTGTNLLENVKQKHYYNLTKQLKQALNQLKTNSNIVIKPADKNLGTTVIERTIYVTLTNEHLQDTTTYKPLDSNPLEATTKKITALIHQLCDQRLIDTDTHNQLLPPTNPRLGYFYTLPKLHKQTLSTRPIISQINHPTRNISQYLHEQLQSTAIKAKTHIQNSQTLQTKLQQLKLTSNIKLFTADITSLYTNIPTTEGIDKTTKMYLLDTPKANQLNESLLRSLLHNTLTQNVFTFNNNYYRQIQGTAMGTIMAPTYANCYLRYLEEIEQPTNNPNLLLYLRYIDDILGVYDNSNNDFDKLLTQLKETYKPLQLTIEHSEDAVNFLDITIKNNKIKHLLETTLYKKPENNKKLIPATSNHPQHTLTNILTNEMARRTNLCSNHSEKLAEIANLTHEALSQRYSNKAIYSATLKLKQKIKKKKENPNKKRLILTYNKHTEKLTKKLKQTWKNYQTESNTNSKSPLRIAYRNQNNLSKHLIRAKFQTESEPPHFASGLGTGKG